MIKCGLTLLLLLATGAAFSQTQDIVNILNQQVDVQQKVRYYQRDRLEITDSCDVRDSVLTMEVIKVDTVTFEETGHYTVQSDYRILSIAIKKWNPHINSYYTEKQEVALDKITALLLVQNSTKQKPYATDGVNKAVRYLYPMQKSSGDTVVHENKTFTEVDYSGKKLRNREFVNCEFISCDFSKSDLVDNTFEDCTFKQCDFSMALVAGAGFRNAVFNGCKLLGIDFSQCNKFMFSFVFTDCRLDYSLFYAGKLKKTLFRNCTLKEVDFSEADLGASVFDQCDLTGARFSNTILEKTDFRTAKNYAIDPDGNKMKKAKFSNSQLAGLLSKHNLDIEFD